MSNYNSPETFRAPGVDDPEMITCPRCKGEKIVQVSFPEPGKGIVEMDDCPTCHGQGVIEPEPADLEDVNGLRDES